MPGADRPHSWERRCTIFSGPAKSNRPLGRPDIAAPPGATSRPFTATVGAWCEAGLGICVLLLPPLLVLVPHGVAPLVGFAGLCAAGLVAASPPYRFAALRLPAAILAALLVWGVASAMWSLAPGRSLVLDARLAGLFAAGLALAAAASRVIAPRRFVTLLIAGIAIGLLLTGYDLVSEGGLSGLVSVRVFRMFRLNQIAVGLAILLLPLTAVLSVIGILTAPLTLPPLAQAPELLAAADALKGSAGHRLLIWSFVGDRIAERPFTGSGLDAARATHGGKEEVRPGLT